MNRIYQGRVTNIETNRTSDGHARWEAIPDWDRRIWDHHNLFQDAVNYYSLCLAGMANLLDPGTPEGRALAGWRAQVEASWKEGVRKAIRFEGPHRRLCDVLGLDHKKTGFAECAERAIKAGKARADQMSAALVQLLQEAEKSDLNQLCVGRLPWFCSPKGKFDGTSKSIVQGQEGKMLDSIKKIHQAKPSDLPGWELDPGVFLTQPPTSYLTADEARIELLRIVEKVAKKNEKVADIKKDFAAYLEKNLKKLRIPSPGRRPKGIYPYALLFSVWPCSATAEILKQETENLKDKTAPKVELDAIAEARVEDYPLFEYFTNIAFYRNPDEKNRAVWFEFDLAAFIEAIKSPHRYFQDTLAREKEAEAIRRRIRLMEGKGGAGDDPDSEAYFGFSGDHRIQRLRELVSETLAYHDEENDTGSKTEYSISERTLRGWREIRRKWREQHRKGDGSLERLIEILNSQQAEHRDDFGSATLFRKLAKEEFRCIWLDSAPEEHNPDDPLEAWKIYKEAISELMDTERPIRFTPAHPEHSPRFFIFPHKEKAGGRFGSAHESKQLAFTSGLAIKTGRGWETTNVRISYSAPRLERDEIFSSDEESGEGKWLQPMMKALGLTDPDKVDLSATRIILNVKNGKEGPNCQLSFPVAIDPVRLQEVIGKKKLWDRQFNMRPDGDTFREANLKWPHEKQGKTPPQWKPWHETLNTFRVLSVDLGQRDAGAFALLEASKRQRARRKPARFIGEINSNKWTAELQSSGLFRLPGEDATVWRDASVLDKSKGETGFAFRQELWGDRGRPAVPEECAETLEILSALRLAAEDYFEAGIPGNRTFPEQNGELLRAVRRAQSHCSRLHRWVWMLSDPKFSGKEKEIFEEIREIEPDNPTNVEIKEIAGNQEKGKLISLLRMELTERLTTLPKTLVRLANRIIPLRGRSWKWEKHPQAPNCFLLDQTGDAQAVTLIRGQRGLSFARIEQIEDLRRRFQSLNQLLRRSIGNPALKQRDETIPDPCPDLLEKLDRLKRQRVNQTAHMILAQALGLKLGNPPQDKKELCKTADVHGVYQKVREPVDFIVIEDLSRYRASQGRSPRENSRLMKWCHRSVRDKLRELAEPFGIPVLETAAAYSSRFCSRSCVPGFRAVEVNAGMVNNPPWRRILNAWSEHQKSGKKLSDEKVHSHKTIADTFRDLKMADQSWPGKVPRTLLLPMAMGPLFVPLVSETTNTEMQPAIAQADINAAINLGLRAVADPRLWSIHPRLRTEKDKGATTWAAKEKRKYGEKTKVSVKLVGKENPELVESKHPNFFVDYSDLIEWGEGRVADPITGKPVAVVWSKALWSRVKQAQWQRIKEINDQRIAGWRQKAENADEIPM